jgi:hypothetical protein
MLVLRNGSIALLFLTFGLPVFAQSDVTTQDSPAADRDVHRARVGIPCWRQAGMTPDMVNRRWELEDQQKVKIAQVCTEPSTSAQQKHDKIDQIHAETDWAIGQLIPAKELTAFNKCQAERDRRRPKGAEQKELGPCGGTIPTSVAADPTTAPEHRHTNTPTNQ